MLTVNMNGVVYKLIILWQDVSDDVDKSWDHPWTTEEMRTKRREWSLAGDVGLLKHLQQFSEVRFILCFVTFTRGSVLHLYFVQNFRIWCLKLTKLRLL